MTPQQPNHPSMAEQLAQAQRRIIALQERLAEQDTCRPESLEQQIPADDQAALRAVLNSTEELIWFVDRNKRVVMANTATIETFRTARGVDVETGMASSDFLPPDQAEYYDQVFRNALQGKTLRFNHSGRNGLEYAVTVQPVRKDQEILGVSIFARDITSIHRIQQELRHFERIIASTPDLMALLDRDQCFHIVNQAYLTAFQKTREALIGSSIRDLLDEQHLIEYTLPSLEKAFSGETTHFETWIHLPAMGPRFLSVTYHPLHSQDLKPRYVVINARDITARKQAEDDRQQVFEISLDMLCVQDLDGCFKELNPAWTRTLGWSLSELKRISWLDLVDEEDRDSSREIGQRLAQGQDIVAFENRCRCKDGSVRWLAWSCCPDPERRRIFSVVRDITERKRMEEELRQLATTDPLTGASNRRQFIEQASAELERSRRYGTPIAVAMLDIDHFKAVNDSYGHSAGDEVLKSLVSCCHQEMRANDIFGRFGGEEFAAVLVGTDRAGALQLCRRLRERLSNLRVASPAGQIRMTVSIGLTMHSADDRSIDTLLKRADDALYQAKNAGRDQLICV